MKTIIQRYFCLLICICLSTSIMGTPALAAQTVKLNKTSVTLTVGDSTTLKLIGNSIKSAKSSNKKVATVTSNGKIKAKKKGKATITVTGKNKKKYKCKVSVNATKNGIYNRVLSEYKNAFRVDYDEFVEDEKYYYNLYPDVIQIVYRYEYLYNTYGNDLAYSYYDIDGNGTDELVIGYSSNGVIIDIYANKNGKAKKLFDDDALGERSGLDVYKNRIIRYSYVEYGPNGGAGSGETYYKLDKNGYKLKKVKKPSKKTKAKIRWKSLL